MVLSTLQVKHRREVVNVWGRKAVLKQMVREGHTQKNAFGGKPEGAQGTSHVDTWRKKFTDKRIRSVQAWKWQHAHHIIPRNGTEWRGQTARNEVKKVSLLEGANSYRSCRALETFNITLSKKPHRIRSILSGLCLKKKSAYNKRWATLK